MPNSTKIIASVVGLVIVIAVIFISMQSQGSTPVDADVPATQELTTTPDTSATAAAPSTDTTAAAASVYKDGTYTASATYRTPETTEPINVTLTLKDDVVTDVSFTSDPQAPETKNYQAQFAAGYKQYVVGKNIDSITISRVSGSSLTSGGFNAALAKIKTQAKA